MDNTEEQQFEVIEPGALAAIERAQIDMQIATARKYPRNLARAKEKMITMATLDAETAAACFYTLKRTDANGKATFIQGPSVRLAEITVACYGNLRAGARVIDNDGKAIIAQGVCHDLENNVMISMETRRRITTKAGKTYSDDMQITTGNAACAIAFRNSVFKVVPMALSKPAYEQARLVAQGQAKPIEQRREDAFAYFLKIGVSEDQLIAWLEKSSLMEVDLSDLEKLTGLRTALKDGETTIEAEFAPAPPKMQEPRRKAETNRTESAPAETKAETKPASAETPHQPADDFDEKAPITSAQGSELVNAAMVSGQDWQAIAKELGFERLSQINQSGFRAIMARISGAKE